MTCAYWIPRLIPVADIAISVPDRIAHTGPWTGYHADGGTVYVMGRSHVPLSAFADPVDTDDGMRFYAPREPAAVALERRQGVACQQVTLTNGKPWDVPLAAAAPRAVSFTATGQAISDTGDEYAQLSWQLHDMLQGIDALPDDERAARSVEWERLSMRLAWLAAKRAYRVTEELLSCMQIISSADLELITIASWGIDPKATAPSAGEDAA